MKHNQYKVNARVWLYPGKAAWHFVTIPKEISADIKQMFGDRARGWGSLPVEITLGSSVWKTSIFPDKNEGAYILPLKSEVRTREKVSLGDTITFMLEIKIS